MKLLIIYIQFWRASRNSEWCCFISVVLAIRKVLTDRTVFAETTNWITITDSCISCIDWFVLNCITPGWSCFSTLGDRMKITLLLMVKCTSMCEMRSVSCYQYYHTTTITTTSTATATAAPTSSSTTTNTNTTTTSSIAGVIGATRTFAQCT